MALTQFVYPYLSVNTESQIDQTINSLMNHYVPCASGTHREHVLFYLCFRNILGESIHMFCSYLWMSLSQLMETKSKTKYLIFNFTFDQYHSHVHYNLFNSIITCTKEPIITLSFWGRGANKVFFKRNKNQIIKMLPFLSIWSRILIYVSHVNSYIFQ